MPPLSEVLTADSPSRDVLKSATISHMDQSVMPTLMILTLKPSVGTSSKELDEVNSKGKRDISCSEM